MVSDGNGEMHEEQTQRGSCTDAHIIESMKEGDDRPLIGILYYDRITINGDVQKGNKNTIESTDQLERKQVRHHRQGWQQCHKSKAGHSQFLTTEATDQVNTKRHSKQRADRHTQQNHAQLRHIHIIHLFDGRKSGE